MSTCDQRGESVAHAIVSKRARAQNGPVQQAPLAMESGGERGTSFFEERQLGGTANMAAPSELAALVVGEAGFGQGEDRHRILAEHVCKEVIVIDSEEGGELVEVYGEGSSDSNGQLGRGLVVQCGGLGRQLHKTVTQVVQGVQEWEVANQAVFRAGGQVVFRDEQGVVLKGTICGLASEDGRAGSAQVRMDFWDQELRAYLPGCVAPHVSSGHGVSSEHLRSGQPAGGPVSVGVRAPPGRRLEERAQSGAVHPTSREVVSLEARSLDPNIRVREPRLYSRSAILGGNEEEELDYDDKTLGAGEQVVAVPQTSTSGQAFQGDLLSRREFAANLSRGEVFDTGDGGLAIVGGTRSGVRALKNVDIAIQAGEEVKESKAVGSSGTVQEVAGLVGAGGFAHKAVGGDEMRRKVRGQGGCSKGHKG
ncbi:hypothetical protein NDU88_005877 [Pleurodeles waltl]|uniref:Uncharacterized protein n=1 Tax=Pleurodeles waltl TaxID=8319 RepID=A0AAV7TW16_PLEWA|nr:hypothetical protein NDU88_005877 [Pleurodeles waltl]